MGIVEELVKIWPNEVCDSGKAKRVQRGMLLMISGTVDGECSFF